MTGHNTTTSAIDTWREVIALLAEAATRGYREADSDPARHSTALWADNLTSAAIELLPPEQDHLLDDVALGQASTGLDMVGLLLAAETATRRHPIEDLPPGASGVIVALIDLAREAGR